MSVRVIDAILALVAIEAAGLVVLHQRTGRGVAPASLLVNLSAGACLLGAVRSGLSGARGPVLLCLGLAGVAHLADLRVRWVS